MEKNNCYKKTTEDSLKFYQEFLGDFGEGRKDQYTSFLKTFSENFSFPKIECIETGGESKFKGWMFWCIIG